MRRLIAVKPLVYATRRLLPGDHFETRTPRDAKVLIALGKARSTTASEESATDKAAVPTPPADTDIAALRAEYVAAVGKNPFPGWAPDTLREKIAAAKAEG